MSEEVKKEDNSIILSKTMSCCGGVAVVPLKYPFLGHINWQNTFAVQQK